MDRQSDLLFQGLDQGVGRGRATQSRHVLDANHVRARTFQILGQTDVILEIVLGAGRITQIARVANCRFGKFAGGDHRVNRHPHVLDPIKRIEDAKHIDSFARRLLHEIFNDIVRVIGVADGIGRA